MISSITTQVPADLVVAAVRVEVDLARVDLARVDLAAVPGVVALEAVALEAVEKDPTDPSVLSID